MPNKTESQTDIQIDVPLTEEMKKKYGQDMIAAMNLIIGAQSDIKDYIGEKKEEIGKYQGIADKARIRYNNEHVDSAKADLVTQIVGTLNTINQLEEDIKSYKNDKVAEIVKYESIVTHARIKIDRNKDTQWMQVTMIKDFKANTKTYVRNDTGEVVRTLPMTEDDLQMDLGVVRE